LPPVTRIHASPSPPPPRTPCVRTGPLFSVAVTAEVRLPEQQASYRTNEFHFTFRCPPGAKSTKVRMAARLKLKFLFLRLGLWWGVCIEGGGGTGCVVPGMHG
jgi:hypothetical protein